MNSILFIQSHRPLLANQEALDALLMGSAFIRCGLLFLADGILHLVKQQDDELKMTEGYAKLRDYGVTEIFCDAASLEQYGLDLSDLVIEVTPRSKGELAKLVQQYDRVLNL